MALRLFGLLSAGALAVALGCRRLSAPRYRGPSSDHFDGRRFHNPEGDGERPRLRQVVEWVRTREPRRWRRLPATAFSPPPRRVGPGAMRVTFVNHATVLLQVEGLNVLTDPIWSERASPVGFAGPRRFAPPGLRFRDLPPIDLVVVRHDHYDHLDLPTLRRLARAHHPRFFLPLGNAAVLKRAGVGRACDLDWWQSVELGPGLRLTLVPSRHFSGRSPCDTHRTLWGGFVLEAPAGRAYFAGDTGFGEHFAAIGRRFGPVRLAVLPIGAYLPRWVMAPMHVSPAEAVRAAQLVGAATAVAVHHGTFHLADEGQAQAARDLDAALARAEPPVRFWHLEPGEGRDVPGLEERARPGASP